MERSKLSGVYAIAESSERRYQEDLKRYAAGADILEYGCGPHSYAALAAQIGANSVLGIDISDTAIDISRATCARLLANDPAKLAKVKFQRMNAEALDSNDNSFSLVCGRAILHHLDFDKCFAEIHRVLKVGGKAIFVEPMGHNPFINWYRDRTPELRTPDEHPFLEKDFAQIKQVFKTVDVQYFHLTSLALVPLAKFANLSKLAVPFDIVDKGIFKFIPPLRKHAWSCVITMTK